LQLHLKAITDLVIDMTILMLIRKGATEQQGTWERMMDTMDEVLAMEDMVKCVSAILSLVIDVISGDRCPYDNENTFRKKREADEDETSENEKKETNLPGGILLQRLKRHDPYIRDAEDRYFDGRSGYYDRYGEDRYRDDRYRDDRYRDDRYRDDRYRDDRYRDDRYRDDQLYRDRYGDRYRENRDDRYRYDRDRYDGYDGRGRGYGRDRCGREICTWEAQIECDLSKLGRGYGRSRYERIRWERENDAYYPRDKYRDLQEYFGTRMRDYGEEVLTITRVKPEDKGVYRCYLEDGDEADFMEIHFFPKFPVDANALDGRDC